jgi:hypothetical protein
MIGKSRVDKLILKNDWDISQENNIYEFLLSTGTISADTPPKEGKTYAQQHGIQPRHVGHIAIPAIIKFNVKNETDCLDKCKTVQFFQNMTRFLYQGSDGLDNFLKHSDHRSNDYSLETEEFKERMWRIQQQLVKLFVLGLVTNGHLFKDIPPKGSYKIFVAGLMHDYCSTMKGGLTPGSDCDSNMSAAQLKLWQQSLGFKLS